MSRKQPTLHDVAELAGVSTATVSATINSPEKVREKTRRKIWEASETLGYRPNALAKRLKLGRSKQLALLLGNVLNPFWGQVMKAIEHVAEERGYFVSVSSMHGDAERARFVIEQYEQHQVAGFIVNGLSDISDYVSRRLRHDRFGVPTVAMEIPRSEIGCDSVCGDGAHSIRMLTEYLMRLGHRRIAFVGGQLGTWSADERKKSFLETMAAAGVSVPPHFSQDASEWLASAASQIAVDMLTAKSPPTAIVGANNDITLGIVSAARQLGYHCPDDISIAGVDGLPTYGIEGPSLTLAIHPAEDMGTLAANWLIDRIEPSGEAIGAPRQAMIVPQFRLGQSCAAPRTSP